MVSGTAAVGQLFSLWDTHHRFDFQVSEVLQEANTTTLVCTSDFLQHLSPKTRFPDMFATKEADTEDPRVAQACSHRFKTRRRRHHRPILIFALALFVIALPYAPKWPPVQLVRSLFSKKAWACIVADDLADDVRHKLRLRGLQEWSESVLARYKAGTLATNGRLRYSRGTVLIAEKEVPFWIRHAWLGETPEISIRVSEAGQPECVVIAWYLSGVLVGPTNYQADVQPWYIVQAKPGVYAYHDYK